MNTVGMIFDECGGAWPKGFGGWGRLRRTGTGDILRYWMVNVSGRFEGPGNGSVEAEKGMWEEEEDTCGEGTEEGVVETL